MSRGATLIITKAYANDDNALFKLIKEAKGCSIMQAMDMLRNIPLTLVENYPDTNKVQEWAKRLTDLGVEYRLEGDVSSSSINDTPKSTNIPSSGGITVTVTGMDGEHNENDVFKLIKNIKGCSLMQAMNLFGNLPFVLIENIDANKANEIKGQLESLGIKYETKGGSSNTTSTTTSNTTQTNKPSNPSSNNGPVKITVTGLDGNENEAFKVIKTIKGCSLMQAMNLFGALPFVLVENLTDGNKISEYQKMLTDAGIKFKLDGNVNTTNSTSTTKTNQPVNEEHHDEPIEDNSETSIDETEPTAEETVEEECAAEKKLEAMIGLTNVKREVEKIKAYIYKNEGERVNCHMFFLGNPGTGKTVVARLMGDILYAGGALPSNKFVECSAKDLIAGYIGQTAIKTGEKVKEAMGGILYIDEAYALNPKENSFGKECVDTLIKLMEDHRGEFCCIFAGYPEDMEGLIESNPGFDSRVKFKIMFDDYTKEELKQISSDFLKSKKYEISDQDLDTIIDIVDMNRYSKNFGNARTARTIVESIMMNQAVRTKKDRKDRTITMEDIQKYADDNNVKLIDPTTAGNSSARQKLNELVGLSTIKETIDDLVSYFTMNKGKKTDFHMAFMGNPGTGKTVVARIVGELLHEEGLLPSSKLLEVTSSDLIAQYIGQTGPKTQAVIQKAMGGVLFIDEAYTLAGGKNDTSSFGAEAVAELLKAMEDKRGDFCVILAGYTKEMHDLFAVNPGLQSRVKFELEFPDYGVEDLIAMCKMYLKKDNYEISDDDIKVLVHYSYSLRNEKNYANARTLREILSKVEIKQAGRVRRIDPTNRVLTIEDMEKALGEKDIQRIVTLLSNGQSADDDSSVKLPMVSVDKLRKDYAVMPQRTFLEAQLDISESVVAIYNESEHGKGESTGFIISDDGYIATCAHCVNDSVSLKVRHRVLHRGRHLDTFYDAKVIAMDRKIDVAIIKLITNDKFLYVPLAPEDVEDLPPLSQVFLTGYPFGVSRFDEMSVNEGKIASYQRSTKEGIDQINLDISAKSGNSGSCVIDSKTGRVIGVLCGSSTSQSGALVEEINYCRPISYVWNLIKENQ